MGYIKRSISEVLQSRVDTSKCTLVVGARQVGKSTLIKHEFPEYNGANFDDRLTRMQAKEEPKLFFLNNSCPLFIDEVHFLYPIEIKMSGNPKANMGATNQVLDKIPDKQRGMGVILCLIDKKTYLRENLIALPISYI